MFWSKNRIARKEKLSVFFQELAIDNFIIGPYETGCYGFDWACVPTSQLDKFAVDYSQHMQDAFPFGLPLKHATGKPHTHMTLSSENATINTMVCGDIEEPWYIHSDGTRYTFLSAKFMGGHFFITTKVKVRNSFPFTQEYSIPRLRELLGMNKKGWFSFLLCRRKT